MCILLAITNEITHSHQTKSVTLTLTEAEEEVDKLVLERTIAESKYDALLEVYKDYSKGSNNRV